MAVPKQKVSKGRKNRRRSNIKAANISTVKCKKCGKPKMAHRICECGQY